MNRSDDDGLHCFWNATVGTCHKSHWSACGYDWLAKVPVGLVWLVWFFAGTYALSQFGTLKFDTTIHDPLGQGIAIALSQRKSTSARRPWLLRYIKLCAIWAEWPTFTFTPLTIAFKISKEEGLMRGFNLNLDGALEVFGVVLVACCGLGIVVLRSWKRNASGDAILKKALYPITFDLFFIPTTTLLARIGTCPEGFAHVALPSGASCECVDKFGVFWAVGFGGFLVLYCSAMYYKMHIEPHGTTMDFRFQTSFQIMMAMARTVNPIVSILVTLLNVHIHPARATPIACAFLIMVTYLLVYSYKTQPCIGSGRIPNNIRVVSFSSSVYASVCVFLFCVTGTSITSLYYSLVPLPVVWLAAWTINDRRAKLFYIPYRPIVDLLVMPEARPQLAGVIAALYADPMKIQAKDYTLIVTRLYSIARSNESEPQSRMYALRTLWFLHCKNFRKSKGQFGEPDDECQTLPPKLWHKDRENPDRAQWTKAGLAKSEALSSKQTQVKIARIDQLSDVIQDDVVGAVDLTHMAVMTKASGQSGRLSRTVGTINPPEAPTGPESPLDNDLDHTDAAPMSTVGRKAKSFVLPTSARSSSMVMSTEFGVIRIRDKQWLSRNEDAVDAVQHCDELFRLAKEVMVTCTAVADKPAMLEAAMYLLQLYQARYLRLHKVTFVRIVSSLCATDHVKIAVDAVHTLYKLVLDAVLTPDMWLRTSSSLDLLLCAMDHPSTLTVAKCVIVAKAVLVAAESDTRTNLFSLLTPASIARLRSAFLDYHANYQISTTLEDICAGLHRMELQRGARHRDDLQKRVAATSMMRNLTQSIKSGAKSNVSIGIERSMPSRRLSLRVSPVDPLATTNLQQLPTQSAPNAASVQVHDIDGGGSSRDLQKKTVQVPTTVTQGHTVHVTGAGGKGLSGGAKIQYLFVQADVMEEIHRRRTVRTQFEQALMRAYHSYNDGRTPAMNASPSEAAPAPSTMSRRELPASFGEIMELYAVPGCALEGMLASVVEPHMKQFFELQVMPFMIIR